MTGSDGQRKKCFLLTGCASGIGRHLAGRLLASGYQVVATDLRLDALQEVAQEDKWPESSSLCLSLNVTQSEDWERALEKTLERFQSLDGLMNIAGYLQPGWVDELEERDIDLHFDVNVKGLILGTHKAAKLMKKQGHGHIVNIASMAALAPITGLALYSASKYAARSFSLAAAQELRPHGVYVTVICPDAVQTPMLNKQKDDPRAALTFSGPERVLQVEDLARLILGKVLRKKPIEVTIPRHRAWLARLGDRFPGLITRIRPILERKGRARQKRLGEGPAD